MKQNSNGQLIERLTSLSVNAFWVILQRTYQRLNSSPKEDSPGWDKEKFVELFSCPHLEADKLEAMASRINLKHYGLLDVARSTQVEKLDNNEAFVFLETLEILAFLLERPELLERILDWAERDAKAARLKLQELQGALKEILSGDLVAA